MSIYSRSEQATARVKHVDNGHVLDIVLGAERDRRIVDDGGEEDEEEELAKRIRRR